MEYNNFKCHPLKHPLFYLKNDYLLPYKRALPWVKAASLVQLVKNLPAMQETKVQSLGQELPLEQRMATQVNILAWRIPWKRSLADYIQSMGLQKVRQDQGTNNFNPSRVKCPENCMVKKQIWPLCKKHLQIAMALKRWEFVSLSCNAAGAVWGREGRSAPLWHAGIQAPAICDSPSSRVLPLPVYNSSTSCLHSNQ